MRRVGAKRLRALLEHRPTELLIAANGLPLGTLKLRSAESDLELAVTLDEPMDFIEIFSEQNARLLLFGVEPAPYGDVEQTAHVDFHGGRSLDLKVGFMKAWPTVRLAYHDPEFAPLLDGSSSCGEAPVFAAALETRVHSAPPPAGAWRLRKHLLRAWHAPLLRPAFGVVTLAAAVALWAALPWQGRAASASELLRGASASERALLAAPNVVVHRVLRLEERRPPARTVVSRHRVELWQDGAHGVAVRRLYDERDRLTAGEWTRSDGSRTVYRPGAARKAPRIGNPKPIEPEAVWEWDPTARHFAELVDTNASPTVESRGGEYLLRYRPAAVQGAAGLVEATLTIRKAEMRAVAHTLVVRAGNELREYEFTETTLASVPAATVPAKTFEPEPELLGRAIPFDTPAAVASVEPTRAPAATRPVLSDDDENRLEVDALFMLHRLEPCLAEPAQLKRASDSGLHARASVRDDRCRERVVERLVALGQPPALRIDVVLATAAAVSAEPVQGDVAELSPAYRTLIDRFSTASTATTGRSETAANTAHAFGSWAEARSSGALAEARELEGLVSAWTAERLATLDVDRMTMWLDVTRDHARRFRRETEQLRQQIESLFAIEAPREATSAAEPATVAIHGADEVAGAVRRLVALAATHDTTIRQMFEIVLAAPRVPVDVGALARSLRAGERQAAWFDEPWIIEPPAGPASRLSDPPR